jgi:multiple sugar transport system substrate-binding protein
MKANSDIKLQLETAPYTDFFKRLRTQLAGGKGPDVWLSDGVLVQEYAGRNSLRDLSDFVKTINTDDYYGVDLIRDSDGHLYGFPQGAQTPVLFYNKKMFADAGVAEPTGEWTYDDLTAAAKKLTRDTNGDGKPDVWGMRVYSPGFTESWWPMIKAFGGDVVADGGQKVVIDSPQSRAGLDWMLNAMYTEKAHDVRQQPRGHAVRHLRPHHPGERSQDRLRRGADAEGPGGPRPRGDRELLGDQQGREPAEGRRRLEVDHVLRL